MGKGTWIASLVLLIISIATLLFSRLNIGNKGMLFGVFTLSLMSSIIFFMISLYKIMVLAEGKFSNDVKDKMDFEDYFNRMNELLQMQFGDKMVWGSGEDIRMYKRRYKILNEGYFIFTRKESVGYKFKTGQQVFHGVGCIPCTS